MTNALHDAIFRAQRDVEAWQLEQRERAAAEAAQRASIRERRFPTRQRPQAAVENEAGPTHVSTVERAAHANVAQPSTRSCSVCGASADDGTLPWSWDTHAVPGSGELRLTCSERCRRDAGLPERKGKR